MPDLTNALVAEWKQIPAAMFQHPVESLPRRVEAVIAAKEATNSILMPIIIPRHEVEGGYRNGG